MKLNALYAYVGIHGTEDNFMERNRNKNEKGGKKNCVSGYKTSRNTGYIHLRLPDPLESFCYTNIVSLKFVQANCSSKSETAEEPVQEGRGLGHTPWTEIIGNHGPVYNQLQTIILTDGDGYCYMTYWKPMWE